jgi:hypothetical protein
MDVLMCRVVGTRTAYPAGSQVSVGSEKHVAGTVVWKGGEATYRSHAVEGVHDRRQVLRDQAFEFRIGK